MSVQGFGQASFYTFQQPLPHPTLPYATQDEWVQFVYPDASAAVYNVARVGAPVNGMAGLQDRHLAGAAAPQPYVAVKAGDFAELAEWFYRQCTDSMMVVEGQSCFDGDEQQLVQERKDFVHLSSHSQCDHKPPKAAEAAADPATCAYRTFQLYLGMSIPLTSGGGVVSQQQLEAFLQAEVSPRVPGFTVLSGTGFWQGESEPVAVLEVVSSEADIAEAVAKVAMAYKRLFRQEAVLLKEAACPAAVQLV